MSKRYWLLLCLILPLASQALAPDVLSREYIEKYLGNRDAEVLYLLNCSNSKFVQVSLAKHIEERDLPGGFAVVVYRGKGWPSMIEEADIFAQTFDYANSAIGGSTVHLGLIYVFRSGFVTSETLRGVFDEPTLEGETNDPVREKELRIAEVDSFGFRAFTHTLTWVDLSGSSFMERSLCTIADQ